MREFNSYEMFIVAHQLDHEILSPELENGTERIGNIVKGYLTFVTDLLFNYVQTKSDYFKAFLLDKNQRNKWAFKYLFESLEKQRINYEIKKEIKGIIKERLLDKISVQTDCPNEFYKRISFGLFSGKTRIIEDFVESLKRVREMKPTEPLHPDQTQQPVELMELLSKATSTHELPEPMFTKGRGLSNEKAILLIMRHLEDFHVPSSDNK